MKRTSDNKIGTVEQDFLDLIAKKEGKSINDLKLVNQCHKPDRALKSLERKNKIYFIDDKAYLSDELHTVMFSSWEEARTSKQKLIDTGLFKVKNNQLILETKFHYLKQVDKSKYIPSFSQTEKQRSLWESGKHKLIHHLLNKFLKAIKAWNNDKISIYLSTRNRLTISLKETDSRVYKVLSVSDDIKSLEKYSYYLQIAAALANTLIAIRKVTEQIINKRLKERLVKMATKVKKKIQVPESFNKTPDSLTFDEVIQLVGMISELNEVLNISNLIMENKYEDLLLKLPKELFQNERAKAKFIEIVKFICDNTELDEMFGKALLDLFAHTLNFIRELGILPFFQDMTMTFHQLISE